jgi:hypothetical protein
MVITIVAGPNEGKSGAAYWLMQELKKLGAKNVVNHDTVIREEDMAGIRENYPRIMDVVVKPQTIHIVTKLRENGDVDKDVVSHLGRHGCFKLHE